MFDRFFWPLEMVRNLVRNKFLIILIERVSLEYKRLFDFLRAFYILVKMKCRNGLEEQTV